MAHLKWGGKNKPDDVKKLQTQLNKTGRAGTKLKVDGIFGPKTYAGVKKFQASCKGAIKVDGVAGPKTQGQIDIALGKCAPTWPLPDWVSKSREIHGTCSKVRVGMQQSLDLAETVEDLGKSIAVKITKAVQREQKESRKLDLAMRDYMSQANRIAALQKEYLKVACSDPGRANAIVKQAKALINGVPLSGKDAAAAGFDEMGDVMKRLRQIETALNAVKI